jgi:hypothetical protein
MSNQTQPFRQHHLTKALRSAAAAGMRDPTVTVTLPTGATITISGKPEAVVKPGKRNEATSLAKRGGRK